MNNHKKQTIRLSRAHTLEELTPFRFSLDSTVILKPTGQKAKVLDAVFHGYLSGGHGAPLYTVLTETGRQLELPMYELAASFLQFLDKATWRA